MIVINLRNGSLLGVMKDLIQDKYFSLFMLFVEVYRVGEKGRVG